MKEFIPAIVMDGAPFWALVTWGLVLSAHALRQPKIRRQLGYTGPGIRGVGILALLVAPLATLALCIMADATTGLFYWCGTFSLAGVGTALVLACLQSRR